MTNDHFQHRARKRFGQNFLTDEVIIAQIVRSINPKPGQHLVEIGPGKGAITQLILEHDPKLDIVELDRDLVVYLKQRFAHKHDITIHSHDALKFDFAAIRGEQRLRIVGNLPYNISTPLIFHLLSHQNCIADMHFMLQKEVVSRLCAEPGSKSYGRLSIMAQYYCRAQWLFDVGPECFDPKPKVDSAIVRLEPHETLPFVAEDPAQLESLVKQAFMQRRKTLRNALKTTLTDEAFEATGLSSKVRPEALSVADYVALSNFLSQS